MKITRDETMSEMPQLPLILLEKIIEVEKGKFEEKEDCFELYTKENDDFVYFLYDKDIGCNLYLSTNSDDAFGDDLSGSWIHFKPSPKATVSSPTNPTKTHLVSQRSASGKPHLNRSNASLSTRKGKMKIFLF